MSFSAQLKNLHNFAITFGVKGSFLVSLEIDDDEIGTCSLS